MYVMVFGTVLEVSRKITVIKHRPQTGINVEILQSLFPWKVYVIKLKTVQMWMMNLPVIWRILNVLEDVIVCSMQQLVMVCQVSHGHWLYHYLTNLIPTGWVSRWTIKKLTTDAVNIWRMKKPNMFRTKSMKMMNITALLSI